MIIQLQINKLIYYSHRLVFTCECCNFYILWLFYFNVVEPNYNFFDTCNLIMNHYSYSKLILLQIIIVTPVSDIKHVFTARVRGILKYYFLSLKTFCHFSTQLHKRIKTKCLVIKFKSVAFKNYYVIRYRS